MGEDYRGRRVLVVGLGRSGLSASGFLLRRGASVRGNDARAREALDPSIRGLEAEGLEVIAGAQPAMLAEQADLIVVSPGIPPGLPLLERARALGLPVWSELELGFRELEGTVVAITGTKGKSTTATLVTEMLRLAGREVKLAGNIGSPLVDELAGSSSRTIFVLEVSSFQLENVVTFRPRVAVLLDVSPDHLDWHPSFEHYVGAKSRIFSNQEAEDWAVVYGGNPLTVEMAKKGRSRRLYFDLECAGDPLPHVHLEGPWIMKHEDGTTTALASLQEFQLRGRHNRLNAMAASATAVLLGASGEALEEALEQFEGLPHALERVGDIGGVGFFNDSKATNVTAVRAALESFDGAVLLIMGGRFKGGDLAELREPVGRKVKGVFAIGESREAVDRTFRDVTAVTLCADLEEAVRRAHEQASPGDVVLLSPAGSSFDMFRDYRERGEVFRSIVERLLGGE